MVGKNIFFSCFKILETGLVLKRFNNITEYLHINYEKSWEQVKYWMIVGC